VVLKSATIKGAVGAGNWTVNGGVSKFSAVSVPDGAAINVSGLLGTLKIAGDFQGDLTAASAKSITIGGNLNGSDLSFTDALNGTVRVLNALTVKGAVTDSLIETVVGNIGTVTVGSLISSKIQAGINGGSFGDSVDDFASDATITKVTIKRGDGTNPTFANSLIQARRMGSINVGTVNTGGDSAFGLFADEIISVTGTLSTGTKLPPLKKLVDPTQSVNNGAFGNFEIHIV
jgi:hypothetical protein